MDENEIPNTDTKWRRWQQTKWAPRLFLEESSQLPEGIIYCSWLWVNDLESLPQGCFPSVLLASVRSQGCLMLVPVSTRLAPSRHGPGHLLSPQPKTAELKAAEDTGGQHCWKPGLEVTSETLTALEVSRCNGFHPFVLQKSIILSMSSLKMH